MSTFARPCYWSKKMIIVFGNGKGGVGKSFAALNTVVELNDRGYPTALVDGQAGNWPTAKRLGLFDGEIPTFPVSDIRELRQAIKQSTDAGYHVVADWAGEMTDEVSELCSLCDLILVPFMTGEQEFIQTSDTLTLIRAYQLTRGGKPDAWVFFNKTKKRDASIEKYRQHLAPLGIPVAEARLRLLDDYRDNRSVMRDEAFNDNNAASDFRHLLDETVMPSFAQRASNG